MRTMDSTYHFKETRMKDAVPITLSQGFAAGRLSVGS